MERQWIRRLIWIGAGALTVFLLYMPVSEARRAARESAQRSLIAEAERQLVAHFAAHGRYPESLEGMQFTFSDGGDSSMLERIEYHTDGQHYRLVTASEFDGAEISACR
jgi:hypothetical protein